MFTIFLVLITIVCFLLIVVIMVQNPKGGGLSSTLGGSQQIGGVQNTSDFLDKSTWTLGGLLIVLILLSSLSFNTGTTPETVPADQTQTEAPAKTETPSTTAPVQVDPAKVTPVQTTPATK
jgi:preprotein translocase subunit SecG